MAAFDENNIQHIIWLLLTLDDLHAITGKKKKKAKQVHNVKDDDMELWAAPQ